jgi:5'-3' exonuclease
MIDKQSPIIDIYNDDIPIDPNGKHLPHQWVLLLPFLDEARINNAFALVADKLSKEEVYRNSEGRSIIFIHHSSPVASGSLAVLSKSEESVEFDSSQGVGMGGVLSKAPEEYKIDSTSNVKAPIRPIGAFDDIVNNQVLIYVVYCYFKL